jgi:hypothetical protein
MRNRAIIRTDNHVRQWGLAMVDQHLERAEVLTRNTFE